MKNFFTNKNNEDKGQETMDTKNIDETNMEELLKTLIKQEVAKQGLVDAGIIDKDKTTPKPTPSGREFYLQDKINSSTTSNKWIDAYGIAKILNVADVTARRWMLDGVFGTIKGKGTSKYPRRVLTEKVMAVDVRDLLFKHNKKRIAKQKESLRNYNENNETVIHLTGDQVVAADKINYQEYKKRLMNDREFLVEVSKNVMSNLKFVTRLEEGNNG